MTLRSFGWACVLQCVFTLAACSGDKERPAVTPKTVKDASSATGNGSADAGANERDAASVAVGDAGLPVDASTDTDAQTDTGTPPEPTPRCGDGHVDEGEACDDGNGVDDDYCSNDCQPGRCGDHVTQASADEACDDGNTKTESCDYGVASCSVCDADCKLVAGATRSCGDSHVDDDGGEQCDDGNHDTEVCAYGDSSCSVCDGSCQLVAGVTHRCGDSTIDSDNGEQCDDGSTQPGDGCDATCQVEVLASCHNSVLDAGEECDDGNMNNLDGCNAACKIETGWNCPTLGTACTPICGDSKTIGAEVCDDGNNVDSDYCSNDCHTKRRCGDSMTQASAGEQCDDGNATTETCAYGQMSCTVCDSSCHNQAGATSYCGDGVVDASNGEDCDVQNDMRCVNCHIVCDTIYITYTSTGSFQVTETTASLGNGTFAQPGGSVIVALTAGATGPASGPASLVYIKSPIKFTTTLLTTTSIVTDIVGTGGTPSNRCPLDVGTLDTATARLAWGACPYLGSHGMPSWTPTEQQVTAGAGPGCLPYVSTGSITCSGPLCGLANLMTGANPQNDSWDQPGATLEFSNAYANVRMRALGAPGDGPGNKIEIPNTVDGRTWISYDGVESSRSCGLKPSGCPAPGAQ